MKFHRATPILYASDVRASIKYFVEQLHFVDNWEWKDPPTFGIVFRDGVEIYFAKDDQGAPNTWLALFVEDIDAYYQLIKNSGAVILTPPTDYEWNMREILVECPDGHKIRFMEGIKEKNDATT